MEDVVSILEFTGGALLATNHNLLRKICVAPVSAALLLISCSASRSANEDISCRWSERTKLDERQAAFLSLIFASPKDRFRPLGLKVQRPAGPDSSVVQSDIAGIDRSIPHEITIAFKGLDGASGVSDDISNRLYINNLKYLDYPRHLFLLNPGDYEQYLSGYSNIYPVNSGKFKYFLKRKSHVGNYKKEIIFESYNDVCVIKSEFSDKFLEKITLYINYQSSSKNFREDKSLCRARMDAIKNGLFNFSIQRIKIAINSPYSIIFDNKSVPYSDMITFISGDQLQNIRVSGDTVYSQVCKTAKTLTFRSGLFEK